MEIFSTYSVKIKHYNHIFKETVSLYREAVDFYIHVCLEHWDKVSQEKNSVKRVNILERFTHKTKKNPVAQYPSFDQKFYKFPSYLRRSAISEALGKVSSYKSNLTNWEKESVQTRGRQPSFPKAGSVYPALYHTNMYQKIDIYEMKIKSLSAIHGTGSPSVSADRIWIISRNIARTAVSVLPPYRNVDASGFLIFLLRSQLHSRTQTFLTRRS